MYSVVSSCLRTFLDCSPLAPPTMDFPAKITGVGVLFLSYCHVKTTVESPPHFEDKLDMILILEHPRDISRNRGLYFRPVETHTQNHELEMFAMLIKTSWAKKLSEYFTYEPTCSLPVLLPSSLESNSHSLYDPILFLNSCSPLRDWDTNLGF